MTDEKTPAEQKVAQQPIVKFFGKGDIFPYVVELPSSQGVPFKAVDHFGKPFVFFYFIKAGDEKCDQMIQFFKKMFEQFQAMNVMVYGVCSESIEVAKAVVERYELPFPVLADPGLMASRDLGLAFWTNEQGEDVVHPERAIVVVDGTLTVQEVLYADEAVLAMVHLMTDVLSGFNIAGQAPVLRIPMVFEPMLCRNLVEWIQREKKNPDPTKPAIDLEIQKILQLAMDAHIGTRVVPRLRNAFRYQPRFREPPRLWNHQDLPLNQLIRTNQEASYREFALMIALNPESVEGGEIEFMEYHGAKYALQTGEAIVFSTQLMQQFLPVTKGDRYWYATFFYTEPQNNLGDDKAPNLSNPSDNLF